MTAQEHYVVIFGPPTGTAYNARALPGNRASVYLTSKPRQWKVRARQVAATYARELHRELIVGPVALIVRSYHKRPQRLIWKTRPMPPEPCLAKPDITNVVKLAEDALKGIWWSDDSQVVIQNNEKWYCAGKGYGDAICHLPRVVIEARPAGLEGADA